VHEPAHLVFTSEVRSVALARRFAVTTLTAWGLGALAEDARLCVSELASNAVLHGADGGAATFRVDLRLEDRELRIEVRDSGAGRPQPGAPADDDVSGRGLAIVTLIASRWGVHDHGPDGKTVWARLALPKSTPPPGPRPGPDPAPIPLARPRAR
jgi:anti-sigma regulatory factor (Ser/Thr protein kinase)